MEYSIWLSWSMSNECIKITVHRSRRNRPLQTKPKNCNFSQRYSYLFFSCPKHSGCFRGKKEPVSVFVVNFVHFQGWRRTGGHKSTVLRKIHFKEVFFGGFKWFFSPKRPEDVLDAQECSQLLVQMEGKVQGLKASPAGSHQQLVEVAGEWPQCCQWGETC